MMLNQEKMWYSIEDALHYLHIEESVFWRKITFFNLETRTLPGMKGTFLSRRDLFFLEQRIQSKRLNNSKFS